MKLELLNSSDEYVDASKKTHPNYSPKRAYTPQGGYKAYKIGDIKRLIYDQSDAKKLAELKKIHLNCIEPENEDEFEPEPKLKTVKANGKQKEIDV